MKHAEDGRGRTWSGSVSVRCPRGLTLPQYSEAHPRTGHRKSSIGARCMLLVGVNAFSRMLRQENEKRGWSMKQHAPTQYALQIPYLRLHHGAHPEVPALSGYYR